MRILIAEDEDVLRGVMVRVLSGTGHDVTDTPNAEEALVAFRENPFPLVVTDIVMGEMSGLDLHRAIKTQSPDTLVVIMTSYATLETATAAVRAGAYDFLIKPFEDLGIIEAMVRRAEDRIALLEENQRLMQDLEQETGKLEALNKALAATLVRDQVTGLYNTSHFREVLETELSRCRRHERTFSLIVSQLTPAEPDGGFVEDSAVRSAANVIAARCRTSDVAGRYGVNGFVLVLPETVRKGATAFGEAIRREVAAAHLRPGRPTTLCVGIATFPDDGDEANRLLDRANEAMCRAIASSLEAALLNAGDGRSR